MFPWRLEVDDIWRWDGNEDNNNKDNNNKDNDNDNEENDTLGIRRDAYPDQSATYNNN